MSNPEASHDAKPVTPSVTATQAERDLTARSEAEAAAVDEDDGGFQRFMWNEDTKEFFGRTGKSWLLITIFYIIFFASLGAFFFLNWYGALTAIDVKEPNRRGDKSLLWDKGPGLTFRPVPDRQRNTISSLIWFGVGGYDNYRHWTRQLSRWFDNLPKSGKPGVTTCPDSGPNPTPTASPSASCLINNDANTPSFGLCSSTGDPVNDFGYRRGEPCILLKLNRIYEWKPGQCTGTCRSDAPSDLRDYVNANGGWNNGRIYIWCDGEHNHDKENLGSIEYFPGPYIPVSYYPFVNQKNYQSPFIIIQVKRAIPGALISIECNVYDNKIKRNKLEGIGAARFQLMMD